MSTSASSHAVPANHTHFKRQNTVDPATIKESRQAASRAAAAGGDSEQPSSLPSPAKPRALPKTGTPTANRTIGPSGGRRSAHGFDSRPSSATPETRTPAAQVASDLRLVNDGRGVLLLVVLVVVVVILMVACLCGNQWPVSQAKNKSPAAIIFCPKN